MRPGALSDLGGGICGAGRLEIGGGLTAFECYDMPMEWPGTAAFRFSAPYSNPAVIPQNPIVKHWGIPYAQSKLLSFLLRFKNIYDTNNDKQTRRTVLTCLN